MSQILPPLLLQAQITPPNQGGSMGLADSTLLENPFSSPMLLDEIRFRLPPTEAYNNSGTTTDGADWSRLRIELKLGNVPLTNGFVPLSLLGKVLSDGVAGGAFSTSPYAVLTESASSSGGATCFTWKLPRSLFIPARDFLRVTAYFQTHSAPTAGTAVSTRTVTIMYACRPLPKNAPTPRRLCFPWVTFFQPADLTCPGAADTFDQSTPADLFNPFDQDLHVQRFVGRVMGQSTWGDVNTNAGLASANVDFANGQITYGTLISAQDSFNNILIRDRTPFSHVFNFLDRSWTVNCMLPPKGFYLFNVDRLWAGYPNPGYTNFVGSVGLSMVGWREVEYAPRVGQAGRVGF